MTNIQFFPNNKHSFIIGCCIFSFVELSIINTIVPRYDIWIKILIQISSSIIIGLILSFLFKQKIIQNMILSIFHKSPVEDVFSDVLNTNEPVNMVVYLKGKDYYINGSFSRRDRTSNDPWVMMKNYVVISLNVQNKEEGILEDCRDTDVRILIRMCDIDYIEVY